MSYFTIVDDLKYLLKPAIKTATLVQNNSHKTNIHIPVQVEDCIVKEISADVFNNNQTLTEIQIPDTIAKIHFCAFRNAYKLERVHIYATDYTSCPCVVDTLAFADCCNLQEVIMDNCKIVNLFNAAFVNCVSLERFDGEIFVLDGYAMSNCPKLTDITFANHARWKPTSFQGSTNIKNITFNGSVGKKITNGDIRWLRCRNIKCPQNSGLSELAYLGATIELF